jgi:hypothetical protein
MKSFIIKDGIPIIKVGQKNDAKNTKYANYKHHVFLKIT